MSHAIENLQESELLDAFLPKWPQMVVLGAAVTREQATEILRRTDVFFQGHTGNNHAYNRHVSLALGLPDPDSKYVGKDSWVESWHRYLVFKEKWGVIETEYIRNSWISSSFIFGPSGWCSPSGVLCYADNVGKYPSGEDLRNEWKVLAEQFPFLRLDAVFFSEESCSEDPSFPLLALRVKDGEVQVLSPQDPSLFVEYGASMATCQEAAYQLRGRSAFDAGVFERVISAATSRSAYGPRTAENGISDDIITEWVLHSRRLKI